MADERVLRLERLAAAGDVEARAQLLLERRRRGDLEDERLQLAAHLGDPAARLAVGERLATRLAERRARVAAEAKADRLGFFDWLTLGLAFGFGSDPHWVKQLDRKTRAARNELAEWVEALELFDKQACVRVAVAAARSVVPHAEDEDAARAAIAHAEEWLACPCADHATGNWDLVLWDDDVGAPSEWASRSAYAAWATRAAESPANAAGLALYAVEAAFYLEPGVRHAIRDGVVPWALSPSDASS